MAQAAKNMPAMQETWIRSLGRSPGEGNGNPLQYSCLGKFHGQGNLASYCPCGCKELDMIEQLTGFPDSSDSKESASNEGEAGSIPGSGRSPGEGNGNPLQYSCLENPSDRGALRVTADGRTQLNG